MADKKSFNKVLNLLCMISAIVAIAMTISALVHFRSLGEGGRFGVHHVTVVNDSWSVIGEDGGLEEFTGFGRKLPIKEMTLSRIFIFDQDFDRDMLSFLARHAAVEVYQDGELVYSHGDIEDAKSGTLLGVYTVNAHLSVRMGEASEVVVHVVGSNYIKLGDFVFGSSQALEREQFIAIVPTVAFASACIILIVMMLLIAFFGRKSFRMPVAYYHYIMFILICTVWVLADMKVFNYLGCDPGVVSMATFECFMMLTMPFWAFLYNAYKHMGKMDLVGMAVAFISFAVFNILHFSGVANFISTLTFMQALIFAGIICAVIQSVNEYRKERSPIALSLILGFFILSAGAVVLLIDYYVGATIKSSGFLQFGMLIFNMVQIFTLIRSIFKLVAEGRKAENYLEMAKTDSLTGLGNRRALELYISDISNTDAQFLRVGCIVCDLNDLKRTNDVYGHNAGDQLIRDFSECLKECFENRGVSFRTGGDEFCIMFSDIEVDMAAMMRRLNIGVDGFNTGSGHKLSCSVGCYADYVPSRNMQAIWDIIKMADEEMYKQKKKEREVRRNTAVAISDLV